MSKFNPLVSIIVCTYNRCEQLRKTIESLLNLKYDSYEIIVVDNNSTDATASVAKEYPVRYVFESKSGVSFARNTGLDVSHGEFVGFIDDDEIVSDNWIKAMLKAFELEGSVTVVTGPVKPQYLVPLPCWLEDNIYELSEDDKYKKYRLLSTNETLGTGNSLFIKKSLDGIRFDPHLGRSKDNLISGEDTDFIQKIYSKGYKAAYSPDALVYHIIPTERITLKFFIRRHFSEGITEYIRKGKKVFWRRLFKPIPDLLGLTLSVLTLNPKRIIARWLRLCQTLGILYGPIYKYKKQRNV